MDPRRATDDERLDDQRLLWAALAHASAADAVVAADPWYAPSPVIALLGRATELALAAYVIHSGAGADTLRYRIANDLEACLAYALGQGLVVHGGITEEARSTLRRTNEYRRFSRTQFPELTATELPSTADLRRLVHALINASYLAVWGESRHARESRQGGAPGLTIDPRAKYRAVDSTEPPRRPVAGNELSD